MNVPIQPFARDSTPLECEMGSATPRQYSIRCSRCRGREPEAAELAELEKRLATEGVQRSEKKRKRNGKK